MKQLLTILFIFSISFLPARAQTGCPDIEWMRFDYPYTVSHIDSSHHFLIRSGYSGSPSIGSYTLPAASSLMKNAFISLTDSTGEPIWLEVAEQFTYGNLFFFSNPIIAPDGNIYTVLNFTWKTVFAGTTYINTTDPWEENALLVKMTPQGQVMTTHLFKGVTLFLREVDAAQNLYFGSNFEDTVTVDGQSFISAGERDILVFKMSAQFQLLWARQIGGSKEETNWFSGAFKVDSQGNVYVSGVFRSPVLQLGNLQLTNPYGNSTAEPEMFLTKIDNTGQVVWAVKAGIQSATRCWVADMVIGEAGNIYLLGYFMGTLNLNNNPVTSLPATDYNSILLRYDPVSQQFSSLVFKGGRNGGSKLLYLPEEDLLILSGYLSSGTIDFYTDSITAHDVDFYVTGVPVATGGEPMVPGWVLHSRGAARESIHSLVKDFEQNLYIAGYYDPPGAFGNYTFPATENGYRAKLGFLSGEVAVDSGALRALQDSAEYQWLDCDNGMQPIAGATQQSFYPAQGGNYAVRVSNSFCSVMSDCYSTTGLSGSKIFEGLRIYPNPVGDRLYIKGLRRGTELSVYDILGRTLYRGRSDGTELQLDTEHWPSGVYLLTCYKDGIIHTAKIRK